MFPEPGKSDFLGKTLPNEQPWIFNYKPWEGGKSIEYDWHDNKRNLQHLQTSWVFILSTCHGGISLVATMVVMCMYIWSNLHTLPPNLENGFLQDDFPLQSGSVQLP